MLVGFDFVVIPYAQFVLAPEPEPEIERQYKQIEVSDNYLDCVTFDADGDPYFFVEFPFINDPPTPKALLAVLKAKRMEIARPWIDEFGSEHLKLLFTMGFSWYGKAMEEWMAMTFPADFVRADSRWVEPYMKVKKRIVPELEELHLLKEWQEKAESLDFIKEMHLVWYECGFENDEESYASLQITCNAPFGGSVMVEKVFQPHSL